MTKEIEKLDWITEEKYHDGLPVVNTSYKRVPNPQEMMDKINEIIEWINTNKSNTP